MLPSSIANLDPDKVLASAKPLTNEDMPGFVPKKNASSTDKMNVRYQKLCFSSPADLIELERIETLAVRNKGVYVLSKNTYSFMADMYIVIGYLESEE